MIEHFESPRPIERITSLPIRDYPRQGNAQRKRLSDLYLPNCVSGDIIQFNLSFEVTNNQYYAVELSGKIRLSPDAAPAISGRVVGAGQGYNVTPQTDQYGNVFHGMHHGVINRSGSFEITESGDFWLIADYYAGGSSFSQSSEALKVERNYGDFTATRFRG